MPQMAAEEMSFEDEESLSLSSWRAFLSEDLRVETKYESSLKEGERRVAASINEVTKLFLKGFGEASGRGVFCEASMGGNGRFSEVGFGLGELF